MNSLLRLKAIIFKEVVQLSRDGLTFAMIVMIPFVQLILFGYAINTDIRNIPVAIVDQSETVHSRLIIEDVKATQVVKIIHFYSTAEEAKKAIINGVVRAALVLPQDLPQRAVQQKSVGQWLVDGSDTLLSASILQLRNMPVIRGSKAFYSQTSQLTQPSNFEVALFFNPEKRTAINIVPGLLVMILTMTMIMFMSAAIVREREMGNIELLITMPVQPIELMLGKILPYIFIGLLQVFIILGLGNLMFDVPIEGSNFQILIAAMLFISASLTLGLIISTLVDTQMQATQMTVFVLMPSILLSGFMFPYEGMPRAAQWIAELLPATHFMRMIRGIVLRGADVTGLWQDSVWLLGFTIAGLLVASFRFKKNLD